MRALTFGAIGNGIDGTAPGEDGTNGGWLIGNER